MEYHCSGCSVKMSRKDNMKRHVSGCKGSKIIEILKEKLICEYCSNIFLTKKYLNNHIKNNCKAKMNIINDKDKEIQKLQKEIKTLKSKQICQNINVGTINNTNINIILVNYEDSNLSKLTDDKINEILEVSDVYQVVPHLIKEIHFNPEIPENHNVCITNMKSGFMNVYRNGQWEIVDKKTEIENIINDKETTLSEWAARNPEVAEILEVYRTRKYEEDNEKIMLKESELMLYNGRHVYKKSNLSSSSLKAS